MAKQKAITGNSKEDVEQKAKAWLTSQKDKKVLSKTPPRQRVTAPSRRFAPKIQAWEIMIEYG